MITLTAKIIISEGDNDSLYDAGNAQIYKNNISKSIGDIFGKKQETKNVFLLGVDKLDGKKTFSDNNGVSYFIGKSVSNANGSFSTPYNFIIKNSNPTEHSFDYFTIEFDVKNNGHPTKIYVDGTAYDVTSPIFNVVGLNGNETHTISIYDWNKPNEPLVVTGFYIGLQIKVDRSNMLDIDYSLFDRSDLKLPSYGIISNTGSISFSDNDEFVANLANWGILKSGQVCEIMLNNTLVKTATKMIAKTETEQWNYDGDNKTVTVSVKDDLEEWQDINVPEISYDPDNTQAKPYIFIYKHLWAITKTNYQMISYEELDETTKYMLDNGKIQKFLMHSGNLWQQWTKLCEACSLHIYKDNNGKVICKYLGGN